MTENAASPQETPSRLTALSVLGLTDTQSNEWARLRGMQYAALSSVMFLRVFSHAILAVFVARVYLTTVPIYWLAPWAVALIGVQVAGARFDRTLNDVDRRKITNSEFYRQSATSVCSGLLWGGAALVFGPLGSFAQLATLMVVLAIIASGSIYFRTSAPLGTVIFTTISGGAVAVQLGLHGEWLPMAAGFVFTVTTVMGAIQTGRTYLEACLSQTAIAEKEEVVSLLLREFEENEADWLWEVDTRRVLRAVSPRFAFALGRNQEDAEGKPLLECIAGRSEELV